MSKLEELIQQYCPDGVEYVKTGNICTIEKGKQLNRDSLLEDGKYPVINGGISPSGFWNEYNYNKNLITISQGGASAGYVNFIETPFWAGAHCYVVSKCSKEIDYMYLYHFIKMKQRDFMNKQVGAGIPSVAMKEITELEVPLPALPVQREIARILGEFSLYTAELAAELAARKRQYEYYREELIFNCEGRLLKLRDVCSYSSDRISADKLDENNYVGVDNLLQNKQGKTISKVVPQTGNHTMYEIGDILIGNIRPYLRKIWLANNVGGTNGDILDIRIRNKKELLPKYLYYVLSSEDFFNYDNNHSKGAKMPRGNKDAVMNYELTIPDVKTQNRIVNILDKFCILTNDISEGLPAEIEARQKQYEYYRDKLLSFKRK